MLRADDGKIEFKSEDVTHESARQRANMGLGRTFQQARVFDKMTVREHLEVVPREIDDRDAEIDRLIRLVELDDELLSHGEDLSGGQQILLGLARTLMLDPDLIMLDEPFAGVNPGLVEDINALLETLRDEEDRTILIISHEMGEIANICEQVIVMSGGQKLIKDTPAKVQESDAVIESYLGES